MTTEGDDYTDARIKHLEMVQDVVARMSGAAAWMKRLAIIVVGAAAALGAKGNGQLGDLPILAIALTYIFWLMDARYHQQERWYRALHDAVRIEPPETRPDFRLTPSSDERARHGLMPSAFTWSTAPFYGALAIFLLLAWALSK